MVRNMNGNIVVYVTVLQYTCANVNTFKIQINSAYN